MRVVIRVIGIALAFGFLFLCISRPMGDNGAYQTLPQHGIKPLGVVEGVSGRPAHAHNTEIVAAGYRELSSISRRMKATKRQVEEPYVLREWSEGASTVHVNADSNLTFNQRLALGSNSLIGRSGFVLPDADRSTVALDLTNASGMVQQAPPHQNSASTAIPIRFDGLIFVPATDSRLELLPPLISAALVIALMLAAGIALNTAPKARAQPQVDDDWDDDHSQSFVAGLSSDDWLVRCWAAASLGCCTNWEDAVGPLREAVEDDDPAVRWAAQQALKDKAAPAVQETANVAASHANHPVSLQKSRPPFSLEN